MIFGSNNKVSPPTRAAINRIKNVESKPFLMHSLRVLEGQTTIP